MKIKDACYIVAAMGTLACLLCLLTVVAFAEGAAFTNPQAVEQALDNSPQAARVVLEETLDQTTVDALEVKLVPPPTLEQQEADLETAKTLLLKTADDADKTAAVAAIDKKLAAIEAEKPKPEAEKPGDNGK